MHVRVIQSFDKPFKEMEKFIVVQKNKKQKQKQKMISRSSWYNPCPKKYLDFCLATKLKYAYVFECIKL